MVAMLPFVSFTRSPGWSLSALTHVRRLFILSVRGCEIDYVISIVPCIIRDFLTIKWNSVLAQNVLMATGRALKCEKTAIFGRTRKSTG
jgi:hypothetical protein